MDSEIIDITEINFDNENGGPSNSFGGGIELLMNEKKKDSSENRDSNNDLRELDNLENELNGLSDMNLDNESEKISIKSDLFSNNMNINQDKPSVKFKPNDPLEKEEVNSTWDGFQKFNDVPIYPDKPVQPQLSKEELLREKFSYLRKLEGLESKGINLSKKYSMESSLSEMQGEYETIVEEKNKTNSVKFQGNMLMACINGIEFLNGRFDPFDIKLDGWGDQVNENINDYDDVFGELYDKYKSKASMAPELKLLFQLGGGGMMIHMTNTMFKSAVPGMDDILRQNPDLMQQFQSAAVNSMGQSNPGFSGFMNNVMNPEPSVGTGSGPPPAMATQGYGAPEPPNGRGGNNNYGSMGMGRSSVAGSNNQNDGISISENFSSATDVPRSSRQSNNQSVRPEMKGPADISDLLSGLKTKTINIQEEPASNPGIHDSTMPAESSTISISDLKDIQSNVGNMPKRTKRRQRSDKNTVSLDI